MNILNISLCINLLFIFPLYYFNNKLNNIKKDNLLLVNKINDVNDILIIKINNLNKIITDIYNKEYIENYKYLNDKFLVNDSIDIINKDIKILNTSLRTIIDNYNNHKHDINSGLIVNPKIK